MPAHLQSSRSGTGLAVRPTTTVLLVLISLTAFPAVAQLVRPDMPEQLVPKTGTCLLWLGPVALWSLLDSPLNRIVAGAWTLWFLVGSVNIVASYYAFGDVYLVNANSAASVYVVFVFVYLLGVVVWERLAPRAEPRCPLQADRPSWACLLVMAVFPVAYLASMYSTLGYLPMLRGEDISRDIYTINYGPLYAYGFLLVFPLLQLLYSAFESRGVAQRLLCICGLVALVGVSVADGRRYYAVVFALASLPFLIRRAQHGAGGRTTRPIAIALLASGCVLYLTVLSLRTGHGISGFLVVGMQLASVGVEYRDFAYSVTNFVPGHIPGYDWARSTIFAGLNGTLLAGFGVDKLAETFKGSAYVWRELYTGNFGIRTGIASELYFAYGFWGLPIVFGIGLGTGALSRWISGARKMASFAFPSVLYAMVLLLPVAQSTATVGAMSLVAYAYCAYWVLDKVEPRRLV